MKTLRLVLPLILPLLLSARADESRFFRIAGPVATTITAFTSDGYVTWANAPTNATFTVQTTSSLLNPVNWVDYIRVPATNLVTTHRLYNPNPPAGMTLIPAGLFMMGASWFEPYYISELPQHQVYVSECYMDRHVVTKALWDDVYQWATNHGYTFNNSGSSYEGTNYSKGPNHPVHIVNWYDCVKWCNARSEKEGRTPAYYTDSGFNVTYRTGTLSPFVNWSFGYRLPTEAEWEKAARGGVSDQSFPWGNTISWSRANYYAYPSSAGGYYYDVNPTEGYQPLFNDGIKPYTSPVGSFAPNGYGLCDMAGNVLQWCWDWYDAYSSASPTDPRGPASGFGRVYRGGSWDTDAKHCRSAFRSSYPQTGGYAGVGFRSVLPSGQ